MRFLMAVAAALMIPVLCAGTYNPSTYIGPVGTYDAGTYHDMDAELVAPSGPYYIDIVTTLIYGANGDSLGVRVVAEASEAVEWYFEADFASSYVQYEWPATTNYTHKTAANGNHTDNTSGYATTVDDTFYITPRCYHSDVAYIRFWGVAEDTERTNDYVAYDGPLVVPIGTVPTMDHDEYRVSIRTLAGTTPDVNAQSTLENWAKPDVVLCVTNFLFEGDHTTEGWEHWVDLVRAQPGSNNQVVMGFSGLNVRQYSGSNAWKRRLNEMFDRMYTYTTSTVPKLTYGDSVYCLHTDGSLMDTFEGTSGQKTINVMSATARDSFVVWWVDEWNHCENRRPNVGIMFDLYDPHIEFTHAPLGGGDRVNGSLVVDRDQDGTVQIDDDDEMYATREGRILLFRMLHAAVAASSSEPDVGDHFLLGANMWLGTTDSEYLAEIDVAQDESYQCATSASTQFLEYTAGFAKDHKLYSRPLLMSYTNPLENRQNTALYNALIADEYLPSPSDINMTWNGSAALMRNDAGGPWILPGGKISGVAHPHRVEVLCQLADNTYPIFIEKIDAPATSYLWHPDMEGYTNLKALGQPRGGIVRADTAGLALWSRFFDHGEVAVRIDTTASFVCADEDTFEYRVLLQGVPVRQSGDWAASAAPVVVNIYVDTDATGGTYNGLTWATAYQQLNDAVEANDIDIVSADEIHWYHCRASGGTADIEADFIDLRVYTTDRDHYVVISAEDDHGGAWNTSTYRLQSTGTSSGIICTGESARFYGLQIEKPNSGDFARAISTYDGGDVDIEVIIDRCIFKGQGTTNTTGVYASAMSENANSVLRVTNCVAFDFDEGFTIYDDGTDDDGVRYLYNCTAVDNDIYGVILTSDLLTIRNCVAFGNTDNFQGTTFAAGSFNAGIDTEIPGTDSVDLTGESADEVFTTPASDDFHAEKSGLLDGAGADLSTIFEFDVDNERRAETWSIGADDPNGS